MQGGLSSAEQELLELLRGKDSQAFTLTISLQNGHWVVGLKDDAVPGDPGQGDGASFDAAWEDIKPYWA
jgi:hypothetical protein